MTFRLFSPCLFGHGDQIRTRDASGALVLACTRCDQTWPVLQGKMITTGPLKAPAPVGGQPQIVARRVVRANISPIRRTK